MKKLFDLPQGSIDKLHKIMKETDLKYEVDAIIFLIENYKRESDIAKQVVSELDKIFTRIRLGTRTAEQNSMAMMHLINTILYKEFPDKEEFLMPAYGHTKHHLVKDAEEQVSKLITNAKQKKDYERSKKGF